MSKSIEILAPLVALICIGLLIPVTLMIELAYVTPGILFVKFAGGVKTASVSGPLLVTIVQVGISVFPTLICVVTAPPKVEDDLL